MRLKFGLLTLCLIAAATGQITAQVAIGSDKSAEKFAALQIDGVNQGLRLSRLTTAERDNLAVGANVKAKGLVIYNTTVESIEFYDGTQWRTLADPDFDVLNGIFLAPTGKIELGGDLTETTTIAQGANPMSFTTNGGTFSVNTDVLAVNNSSVAVNASAFTVKNGASDAFKITNTGAGNTIAANGVLDVNSGALNVTGTTTTVGGTFIYRDGTQGDGKVLTSDAGGIASWQTLTPSTSATNFTLSVAEGTSSSRPANTNYLGTSFGAITNAITMGQGKWVVSGMLYTYTYNQNTSGANVPLISMRLFNVTNNAALYVIGNLPELKTAGGTSGTGQWSNGAFSAIPMTCLVEVPVGQTWTVRIDASVSLARSGNNGTYLSRGYGWLNPTFGSSFKATRVNN